ncbi:CaiB/BaiF CoA transferase family protein [Microbacterium sp.]|uniref:CaiB/BaiF CoA transferase family protein n=1 Tax=Microbacterium sp. TaxID=51671 RepID=UPI0037C7A4D8
MSRSGPLAGVKVLELQGLGPGPFGAMILSDLGAEVVRVDRLENVAAARADQARADVLSRGRRSIGVDLKSAEGVETVLRLVEEADVLIEGFRPGVTERLGLGPDVCTARNPRLIYGRVTGFGQTGPWSGYAGHDVNYISLSGALWPIGREGEAPVPPLAYLGDFAGGGMLLVIGVCAALVDRAESGRGQVIDAAMVDGSALLTSFLHGMRAAGSWRESRADNLLDTGTPYYEVYETADGKWVSVGAMEPKFFANMVAAMGIDFDPADQFDRSAHPRLREQLSTAFRTRTRDEWVEALAAAEACFAPVLSPWEAPDHAHNVARSTFTESHGVVQPAPAPRFSRTTATIAGPPPLPGEHTADVLTGWGFSRGEVEALLAGGRVAARAAREETG